MFKNWLIKKLGGKLQSEFDIVKTDLEVVELLKDNPYTTPPTYEKLIGFDNIYSRRINSQHRLVYEIRKEEGVVVIIRMWTHYE